MANMKFALAGIPLFALVALSGCVNTASSNPISTAFGMFGAGGPGWWATIAAAGAFGTSMVAISYLWAAFTSNDKMKVWVKRELGQVIYSMILAVAIVALCTGMFLPQLIYLTSTASGDRNWQAYVGARCIIPAGSSSNPLPCHIAIATDYLDILFKATKNEAQSALSAYTFLAVLHSVTIEIKGMVDPAGIVHFGPMSGLSIPVDTLAGVIDLSIKNMMTIRFQQFLLYLLHVAFFPLFLTLGIILRSIFFTRKIGALLISLAVSFYIVFPMMYVFFHGVLFSLAGPFVVAPGSGETPIDLDALYTYSISWQRSDGEYITPLIFVSNNGLQWITNGATITDAGGNAQLNNVRIITDGTTPSAQNVGEKYFTAFDGIDTKEYFARSTGGPASIYGMPYPQGTLAVPATGVAPSGSLFSAPSFMNSSFRAQYGDPADPSWATDKNKVQNLASTIVIDICPNESSQVDPQTPEGQKLNGTLRIANEFWYDRLHEGYINGVYYMLDPATGGILGRNGPVDNLAKILVYSLIAPFLAIMVALSSVKALSPLLGGDAEIAGLTRLI